MKNPFLHELILQPEISNDQAQAYPVLFPEAIGNYYRQQDREEVEAKRRRQSGDGRPVSPRRAEAPSRGRDDQDRGGGSSFGGGDSSSGGGNYQMPSGGGSGRGMRLPIWGVIAIIILYFIFRMFTGGEPSTETPGFIQGEPTQESFNQAPSTDFQVQPTLKPAATKRPSTNVSGQKWLIMLYQDADDKILEQDIMMDLNEVEKVGSTDQVQIVSQTDRYDGGYSGDGNWSTARRYFIERDNDLLRLTSPVLDDLGEVNMADGNTLVDFVSWAVDQYPADKYVLILSDHGLGWPGGWSDSSVRAKDSANVPIASAIGDNIFLMELDKALNSIVKETGIGKFEMIGLDACLMSDLEVLTALEPYAHYAVASQETEPGIGWAYTSFLENLVTNPGIDGSELGRLIVDSYVSEDQRLLDDRARADFLGQSSPMSSIFGGGVVMSAAQIREQLERDITLTAVDLSQVPDLNQQVNQLAYELQGEQQNFVARARNYAQSYTSVWGSEVPPSYIDLGNFAQLLINENSNQAVINAADRVIQAINNSVVVEKHGRRKPGSTGISIYFPNSALYGNKIAGAASYTKVANRFSQISVWDDFLAFHYTNRQFEMTDMVPVEPSSGLTVRGPGSGAIEISPITLSSNETSMDLPVKLTATILGDQIGYVYLYVAFYDQNSNSILALDTDYLESEDTREANGVFYPIWPQGSAFDLSVIWEPTVFEISDGTTSEAVLLNPVSYGATSKEAVYTLDGMYTFADSGEQRHARLYFSEGSLRQVFGFTDQNGQGAPAEIYPSQGDAFTIQQKWTDIDPSGNLQDPVTEEGSTFVFGQAMFTWEEVPAAPGEYVIGFLVRDMDGQSSQSLTQITVR